MAFGDFTVTRASTKLRIGSNGLYGSVANNVPAFEFNTDGSYRGLLVEPGATNQLLRSQEFGTTWTAVGVAVTSNTTVSPDGATTGDTITADGLASTHRIFQAVTATSGLVYTASVFVKAGTNNFVQIAISGATPFGTTNFANFDLSAGTVGLTGGGQSGSIQNVGGGWYRISSTITAIGTGSGQVDFLIIENANSARSQSWTTSNTLVLWQADFIQSSVATSPIVTTAGTASRVADVVSLTGASSLIGQTEGTLYAEVNTRLTAGSAGKRILCVSDGTLDNRIEIIKASNDGITMFASVGGSTVVNETYSSNLSGTFRICVRYAVNSYRLHVNGALRNSDTVATVPACTEIRIGNSISGANVFNDHISSVALFPISITEAQANSLTTV